MRFPLNVSKQKKCPVCKSHGPGTRSPVTPRPEVTSISFLSMPVGTKKLDSLLTIGWDSGLEKHRLSRTSIGDSFTAVKFSGDYNGHSQLDVEFCSTDCMRKFFNAIVDELERRINNKQLELNDARALLEQHQDEVGPNKAVGRSRRSRES